jgi:hypothetical protein
LQSDPFAHRECVLCAIWYSSTIPCLKQRNYSDGLERQQ